jgi:hypothetical protein
MWRGVMLVKVGFKEWTRTIDVGPQIETPSTGAITVGWRDRMAMTKG